MSTADMEDDEAVAVNLSSVNGVSQTNPIAMAHREDEDLALEVLAARDEILRQQRLFVEQRALLDEKDAALEEALTDKRVLLGTIRSLQETLHELELSPGPPLVVAPEGPDPVSFKRLVTTLLRRAQSRWQKT